MRAITVKQPWATAIRAAAFTARGKTVENRSRLAPWTTAVGETLAIHAGQGWDPDAPVYARPFLDLWEADLRRTYPETDGYPTAALLPYGLRQTYATGLIIATATLADVHSGLDCDCDPWADPSAAAHLVLGSVRDVVSPPVKGALGLWTVPDDVAATLPEAVLR